MFEDRKLIVSNINSSIQKIQESSKPLVPFEDKKIKDVATNILNQDPFAALQEQRQALIDHKKKFKYNLFARCYLYFANKKLLKRIDTALEQAPSIKPQVKSPSEKREEQAVEKPKPTKVEREEPLDLAKVQKVALNIESFPISETPQEEDVERAVANSIDKLKEQYQLDLKNVNKETPEPLKEHCSHLVLMRDPSSRYSNKDLLGSFDVLATPCAVDYSASFEYDSRGEPFYLVSAPSINLAGSEYVAGDDFQRERYLSDMQHIFSNILDVQDGLGVKHSIWVPFGMGSSLRQLDVNLPESKMKELRLDIARRMVGEFAKRPEMEFHLCLPTRTKEDQANSEALKYAIQEQILRSQGFGDRITIYENGDPLDIARGQNTSAYQVGLVNPTNRRQIGGRWKDPIVAGALDTTAHQRAPLAAAMAHLVNGGVEGSSASDRVFRLGGSSGYFVKQARKFLAKANTAEKMKFLNKLSKDPAMTDWACYQIVRDIPGLDHFQFRNGTIKSLCENYALRRSDKVARFLNTNPNEVRLRSFLTDEDFHHKASDFDLGIEQVLGVLDMNAALIQTKYPGAFKVMQEYGRLANTEINALLERSKEHPEIIPALRELISDMIEQSS